MTRVILVVFMLLTILSGQTWVDEVSVTENIAFIHMDTDQLSLPYSSFSSSEDMKNKGESLLFYEPFVLQIAPQKESSESIESKRKSLFNLMSIKRGNVIQGSLRV
ncbi:hypothetical protein [Bacillus solitudinis]|uniref:hypothetical protein n=1 Tax=Bacillus solitudinis TaxID=2014074 RepID=UPI000C23BFE5|nr:hypothetical protein [Bacillus solitudinis]